MGKSLVIKDADFSANAIGQVTPPTPPTPPTELEWHIGNISSTGELRVVDTAIYSDMIDIIGNKVSILAVQLDDSVFVTAGIAPVIALYNGETFITRIVGNKNAGATAYMSAYPTATKVRFAIGNFKNNVTDVSAALETFTYETVGV